MAVYFYPNRPILVPPDPDTPLTPKPDYINGLEQSRKYVAEQKWNGDNCLIYVSSGKVEFWNRHGKQLKYQAPASLIQDIKAQIPDDSIVNAELLHSKTKNVKDTLVIHCIVKWSGKLLSGETWGHSRMLIVSNLTSTNHLIISPIKLDGFWDLFQTRHGLRADGSIIQDKDSCLIEGIVLKDPAGIMRYSTTPQTDVSWMLKIRHPSKKYSF